MRQSQDPHPRPERQLHEIDAVIENIADGARDQRDAGKLAVDRVEERHRISGYKSPTEHTLPEQRKGDEAKSETRKRYLIGRDAKLGAELGHKIGRANVRTTVTKEHLVFRQLLEK